MEERKMQNQNERVVGGGYPFLSFIVPVYNVENYLRDCLDSLLTQNVEKDEYEIICVNDGSTDSSLAILREYEKEYTNVRVIDKENGGVSSARNVGLQAAQGEYIWFVDGDDAIRSNCLEELFTLLKTDEYEFLRFDYKKVEEDYCFSLENKENFIKKDIKQIMVGPHIWHGIISIELLRAHNLSFRTDLEYGEDALFSYYVWLYMNQEKCLQIDNALYYYRKRSSSAMHSVQEEKVNKQVRCFIKIAKIYQQEMRLLNDKEKKKATKQRQHLAIINALTFMPETVLNYGLVFKALKAEKLYPFPFLWRHIFESKGIKGKILEFTRNLFKFKILYLIYYKIAKKNRIIKKHKESV